MGRYNHKNRNEPCLSAAKAAELAIEYEDDMKKIDGLRPITRLQINFLENVFIKNSGIQYEYSKIPNKDKKEFVKKIISWVENYESWYIHKFINYSYQRQLTAYFPDVYEGSSRNKIPGNKILKVAELRIFMKVAEKKLM